jgi:hypothetical protein
MKALRVDSETLAWMRKRDFPFQIFIEASVDLAGCDGFGRSQEQEGGSWRSLRHARS